MKSAIVILSVLVALLYLKWVLIVLVFPFQAIHGQVLKRYMLYQVGLIPSHHVRRFVYRALGAEIGKNVVFHFKTEIRGSHRLKVGAGNNIGDNALIEGAGCVVTKDVESYAVVAGIPAKKVNEHPRDLRYVFDGKSNRLY